MKIKILPMIIIFILAIGCIGEKDMEKEKTNIDTGEQWKKALETPTISTKTDGKKIIWKQFTSPKNRFSIYIPEGWRYKEYSADEANFAFSPSGKEIPEIGILFYFAVDQNDVKKKMSAKEFLENTLLPEFRKSNPDLNPDSILAKSDTIAEMKLSGNYLNQRVVANIIVYMDYLYDPTMPGQYNIYDLGGYFNFGFITTAIATDNKELEKLKPTASQLTGSFKPNNNWLAEIKSQIANGIATRTEMIKGTVRRISQMEYEQRMSEMQSSYNIGLGWINALGGTANVRNPETGDVWHVDYTYKYYYQKGNEIMGTDDTSGQPGWTELQIIR